MYIHMSTHGLVENESYIQEKGKIVSGVCLCGGHGYFMHNRREGRGMEEDEAKGLGTCAAWSLQNLSFNGFSFVVYLFSLNVIRKQGHELRGNRRSGWIFKEGENMKQESEWTREKIELFGIVQSLQEMPGYDFKVRVVIMVVWIFSQHLELPTG